MNRVRSGLLVAAFFALYFAGARPWSPALRDARDAVSDGAAADGEFLERARAHYRRLKEKGLLNVDVRVSPGTDPEYAHTPGYALFDHARKRCDVFINADAVRIYDFAEEFSFRFMLYHELSHCDLYANPREINAFPALTAWTNRMISDLVHLEYLHPSEAGRVNGYNAYHETYADTKALGMLIAEGQPRERIESVIKYREGNAASFTDDHDNAGVFSRVLSVPWARLGAAQLENEARSIADSYVPVNFLEKVFRPRAVPFKASDLLAGSLRMPFSALAFQYADPDDRAFVKRRLAEIADAPQAGWREYAGAARESADDKSLIRSFFLARYGAGPEELAAEDEALREALESALKRP